MRTRLMAVLYVFWGISISLCFLPVFWKSAPDIFFKFYIPIVVVTFLLSIIVLIEAYFSSPTTKRLYPTTPDNSDDVYDSDDYGSDTDDTKH